MKYRRVTPDLAIEVALARYAPLSKGEREISIEGLAERFGLSKNTVVSALGKAFQQGWVEVRRGEGQRHLDRPQNTQLEDRLKERFPMLRERDTRVVVVDTLGENSDATHAELGFALARYIGLLIRDGSRVGLGSGRGPYYTAKGLGMLHKVHRRDVQLYSLTGVLHPRIEKQDVNALVDADNNANELGKAFKEPVSYPGMVPYPIAYRSPAEAAAARELTWLGSQFQEEKPNLAIVGVGVLGKGHRFYEAVIEHRQRKKPANKKHIARISGLEPILGELDALVAATEKVNQNSPHLHLVADVCNRLFYLPPPREDMLTATVRREVEKRIDEVNGKLLNITDDQLAAIEDLVLIAGSLDKAPALKHMLSGGTKLKNIQLICIDAATVRRTLAQ